MQIVPLGFSATHHRSVLIFTNKRRCIRILDQDRRQAARDMNKCTEILTCVDLRLHEK